MPFDILSSKKQREKKRSRRTSRRRSDKQENRQPEEKGQLRQWGEALVFALVIMLIVRTLFFDLFQIPTPSMEKNLLVGDYLFVSKVHYGTRLPMTVGVPFTQIYFGGVELPYTRLPGFTEIERGDAVVFNYPPETQPIDRKIHYVKRVVGLPGESLEMRDKQVYASSELYPLQPGMQHLWTVKRADERFQFSPTRLADAGVTNVLRTQDSDVVRLQATQEVIEEIREWNWIESVEPYIAPETAGYSASMFPPGRDFTPDNYGPVDIPNAGQTVTLTDENYELYEPVISRFEDNTFRRVGENEFEINGMRTNEYTVRQDYYFVLGDNRDDSEDSRFWGFVPEDHIVGKALMTYFSWDGEANRPRFNRIFRPIN